MALYSTIQIAARLGLRLFIDGHGGNFVYADHRPVYDPENLIVGILGGAKGTTRDTFELAHQAEQSGARVALFGRKINLSEAPLELVRLMRETIEQRSSPEEAVRLYHEYLTDRSITPQRSLTEDIEVTDPVLMSR